MEKALSNCLILRQNIFLTSLLVCFAASPSFADQFSGPGDRTWGNQACSQYVQQDGHLGSSGLATLTALNTVAGAKECFIEDPSLGHSNEVFSEICPNFHKFSIDQRQHFFVYFMMALSFDESSCGENLNATGIKSQKAEGQFMLEYDNDVRRRNGRDPDYCAPGKSVDTTELGFNLRCAIATIRDYTCGRKLVANEWTSLRNNKYHSYPSTPRDQVGSIVHDGQYYCGLKETPYKNNSPAKDFAAQYKGCR